MGTNPSKFEGCPKCPVENVSWNDAKDFIKKLNAKNDGYEYRLPSEAEWEYAARGGKQGQAFGIGDGKNLSSEEANFKGNYPYGNAPKGKYLQKTTPVGSYKPNTFGLYDMHGNLNEWCEDIYADSYSNLSTDGSANVSIGDSRMRVLRGGSWINASSFVRSASRRLRYYPDERNDVVGFRITARQKLFFAFHPLSPIAKVFSISKIADILNTSFCEFHNNTNQNLLTAYFNKTLALQQIHQKKRKVDLLIFIEKRIEAFLHQTSF